MSEDSVYQALRGSLGYLRLATAAEALPAGLDCAQKNKLGHSAFLHRLLEVEVDRDRATPAKRSRALRSAPGPLADRGRVARLMIQTGLAGRCRRRFSRTTFADPEAMALNLLARNFGSENLSLDTTWSGDITYVRT